MEQINKQILRYDINCIHEACQSLGHSCNWKSFKNELKTYSLKDKELLLNELKGGIKDNGKLKKSSN